ncbi:hypothetical protein ACSVDA_12145 [Cytobacillus sp. Hm23]
MIAVSIILLILVMKFSESIVIKYGLQNYFVSIPFIGSVLMFIISAFFNDPLTFPLELERIMVTAFLFSIGMQMASVLNRKYISRLVALIIICALLITFLNVISYLLSGTDTWVFSSIMFAFNIELVSTFVSEDDLTLVSYWCSIQMLLVFFITPIFLLLSRQFYSKDNLQDRHIGKKEKLHIPFTKESAYLLAITTMIVAVFKYHLFPNIPFVYDFVLGMFIGLCNGLHLLRTDMHLYKKKTEQHQKLGTISLYGFIILNIYRSFMIDHSMFSLSILYLIIIKTVIIAILSIFIVHICFKKWTFSEKMVAAVAGWTFMLNAPVVCMHGMRTVVNRYGSSPYVLLVVPPVILWLVNYVHLWLNLNLLQ